MNKLKISRAVTPDLSTTAYLPMGIHHGRRPGSKLEAQSDCHYYNPVASTHFSSRPPVEYSGSRPPIEYLGSQHDSQQSYSQAVLTQSQNSQQISQQSGEDVGLPDYSWWNGSRARHLINKRPLSPNHATRPTQVPHNSKDGRYDLSTSQLTAQTLLQQISNRQGPTGKCTLTELMEKRLMDIQNCLNGMVKRLDELQVEVRENFSSIRANVQDAARDADITRKESTLQRFQLEELSDEQKRIPTSIAEQITELKVELLQSQKKELQCMFSESKPIAGIIPDEYEHQRIDPGGHYKSIQREAKNHEGAGHEWMRMPLIHEEAQQICHETRQKLTKTRRKIYSRRVYTQYCVKYGSLFHVFMNCVRRLHERLKGWEMSTEFCYLRFPCCDIQDFLLLARHLRVKDRSKFLFRAHDFSISPETCEPKQCARVNDASRQYLIFQTGHQALE